MKEGLIRLTDEKDVFYDSIEKVYRYRMRCPNCSKVGVNCRCYQDLDALLSDIGEGLADFTCSAKCALIIGDWDELDEAMQEAGLQGMELKDLTEEEADIVLEILIQDADFDYPSGVECET